jgi:hypothetical protein
MSNDRIGKDLELSGCGITEVISRNLLGETEKTSVTIERVQAGI